MKLKLKKKPMKSLSNNDNLLPNDATKKIAGGGWWPTEWRICRSYGEPD
ncbi:hypothetical protein [Pseudoalteromonas byunsanensis]|nr:hypothetical protein [Pseudoalteromonas byunsanensis]